MASIRRQGDRYEIRECVGTEKGPRQRTLASFRRVLTPEVLDRAEAVAVRPFEREEVLARARALGLPTSRRRRFPEARALLARLQRGARLDPTLVTLLRRSLDPLEAAPLPAHLEDAAAWIGQPEHERGRALRGLVRAADRIVGSRGPLRLRPTESFPRFRSDRSPGG